MERREFLKMMGIPAFAAVGIVFGSGLGQPVGAGKNKRRGSDGGGNRNMGSSGQGNTSGLSGTDLGSGRFKSNDANKNDKGLVGDDVGARSGTD